MCCQCWGRATRACGGSPTKFLREKVHGRSENSIQIDNNQPEVSSLNMDVTPFTRIVNLQLDGGVVQSSRISPQHLSGGAAGCDTKKQLIARDMYDDDASHRLEIAVPLSGGAVGLRLQREELLAGQMRLDVRLEIARVEGVAALGHVGRRHLLVQ